MKSVCATIRSLFSGAQDRQLEKIRRQLSAIKAKGYIKTHRNGPTGIGKTLETELGLKENNISLPDLGEMELKAVRERHTGLITLFTFNKAAWQMPQTDAIRQYGSKDANGRMGLYYTLGKTPNSAGLFMHIDDENVSARSVDGTIVATWSLAELERKFEEKVSSVLLVKASVEQRGDDEYFCYNRAKLLSGGTSMSILKSNFENEVIRIDLRVHANTNSAGSPVARNHGTGFRASESDLEEFYTVIRELEI